MKFLVSILVATAFFVSSTICGQEKVTITAKVINVTSENGKVGFALYSKDNFMKKPIASLEAKIKDGISIVEFKDITPGEYAVISYHDKNNNDKMDFATNGMPLEDYGASNNVMNFGPPTFYNAKFTVSNKNVSLDIKF